ncbi:MAG: CorA family divalent cation transporter [Bacteriovoracaceae bacterium]|nr:CorA family divalent cation transporter [Bacteriovoracaceae bacterium]
MKLTWDDVEKLLGKDSALTVYDDFHEEIHQTQFYDLSGGHAFIFRYLTFKDARLVYDTEFYLKLDGLFWIYREGEFQKVCDTEEDFLDILYIRFERNKDIVLIYANQLDALEDTLYDGKTPNTFMDNWFDLKKDISKIERYLNRQLFAHKDYLKHGIKRDSFPNLDFANYINDIQFLMTTAQGLLGRLDNAHNYYTSLKNDKLNKNIYFLTLLSGIFLPLNLIVGFFGMNTEGLFFKDNPAGTTYVVYTLFGILLVFLLGFNLVKTIDRLFFRWWLGRSKVYNKMADKVDEVQQKWTF